MPSLQIMSDPSHAGRGHLGGTFSGTDLLVAMYYGGARASNLATQCGRTAIASSLAKGTRV